MPLMVWPVSPNMPCDGPRYDPYLVVAPDGSRACAVPRYREHLPNGVSYQTLDLGYSPEDDYPPVVVPDGHVFLMGVNRDDSADSGVEVQEGDQKSRRLNSSHECASRLPSFACTQTEIFS